MKISTTETTPVAKTPYRFEEPTHDEVALAAFLAWEKEGRQPGREMDYWLKAEGQLRAARLKKAEAAASEAALPWPRPSRATQVKKAVASADQNLSTDVKRGMGPKKSTRMSGRK